MKNVTNLDTDNINKFYLAIWQVQYGWREKEKEAKCLLNLERIGHRLMPLKLFLGLYIENIEINTKQVSEYPQKTKILKNASSLDHGVAT